MDLNFCDTTYDRLETDKTYTHGLPKSVVTAYRKHTQLIRAAHDEADLAALRMLGLRRLPSNPRRRYATQLAGNHELVLELRLQAATFTVWIDSIRERNDSTKRNLR